MDFPSPCLLGSIALAILCILSPFIAHLLYSTAPHREDLDPEEYGQTPPADYSGNPQEDAPSYFPNPRDFGGH